MKKQIKIISIVTILIIAILSETVGAAGSSAMCKGLLTAVGLQEQVLYGDSEDNLTIDSGDMVYNKETQKYDITLEVSTSGIADGTQLTVTQEAYGKNNTDLTDELGFTVSGNTVNSNAATIVVNVEGDVSNVKRMKIIVTYTREDSTTESEYMEFKINLDPTVTIGTPVLESTNLPEDVAQKIKLPVITEDIDDGAILNVKLVKDGIDIDETKYSVEGNTVTSSAANIVINAGLEITIGSYVVEVAYEYAAGETTTKVSDKAEFEITSIQMKSIVIDQPAISLEVDESTIITYRVVPSSFTDDDLKFTSEDETVATITAGGLVKAVGRGETTLTISSLDDTIKATCQITVLEPAIEITKLTTDSEPLKQGEEATIEATILTTDLENGKALDVSIQKHEQDVTSYFTIEGNSIQNNEVILVITPDITQVGSGEYTIIVSFDGKPIESENLEKQTVTFKIEGNVVVTGITVDKETTRMIVGATRQITATLAPEDAENQKIIWKSNNEEVATVDENGLITAEAIGTALITVCSDENPEIYKTINVTVQEIVKTEEYTIDNENRIIKYIPENTTVSALMENIRLGSDEYTIVNKAGTALSNEDLVGTDTKLSLEGQDYKLAIIGDTNGDGKITVTDVSKLKLHIVELETLTNCAEIAADMNKDQNITPTDLSRMKLYLVGIE